MASISGGGLAEIFCVAVERTREHRVAAIGNFILAKY